MDATGRTPAADRSARRGGQAARWAAAVVLCLAAAAAGQIELVAEGPDGPAVGLGPAGLYKLDFWTPVHVTIRCPDGIFKGYLGIRDRDIDGDRARYRIGPIYVNGQGGQTFDSRWLYARLANHNSSILGRFELQLTDAAGTVVSNVALPQTATNTFCLPRDQRIIAVCGPGGDQGLEQRARWYRDIEFRGNDAHTRLEGVFAVAILSPERLPDSWMGYEAADTLILTAPDPELLRSRPQWDAIQEWVARGGHLIISVAGLGQAVAADRTTARFLGVQMIGAERPLASPPPAVVPFLDPAHTVVVPLTPAADATVDDDPKFRDAAGVPVIVRRPHGMGLVTCLGFDPARLYAEDRTNLFLRLARLDPQYSQVDPNHDPSTELEDMVQQFPGSSVGLAIPLILAYVGAAGPLHWWLTRRGKRARWAWLTFCGVGLAGAVVTYLFVTALRGAEVEMYQVQVLDRVAGEPRVLGATWAGVNSTLDTTFDLQVAGGSGVVTAMARRQDRQQQQYPVTSHYDVLIDRDAYHPADDPATCKRAAIRNAVKCFQARWSRSAADGDRIDASLQPAGAGGLSGLLTNNTQADLGAGWLLVARAVDRQVYQPDSRGRAVATKVRCVEIEAYSTRALDRGESLNADALGRPWSGEQLLRRLNAALAGSVGMEYSSSSVDRGSPVRLADSSRFYRIVLAASLTHYYHCRAEYRGPESYPYTIPARFTTTQLTELDLSGVLQPGRAVWIVPVERGEPDARIEPVGHDAHQTAGPTVIRCSIPVKQGER